MKKRKKKKQPDPQGPPSSSSFTTIGKELADASVPLGNEPRASEAPEAVPRQAATGGFGTKRLAVPGPNMSGAPPVSPLLPPPGRSGSVMADGNFKLATLSPLSFTSYQQPTSNRGEIEKVFWTRPEGACLHSLLP